MRPRTTSLFRAALLATALVALTAIAAQAATKVHWYGQSAFRIETPSGGVILIDPWLSVPTNPDKDSVAKLGKVDYIFLTHGHRDHVGECVEIAKKTGAVLIAPYGLSFNMKSVLGYPEKQATTATGGNVGGTIDLANIGVKVTFVNAIHGSELTLENPPAGQPAAITSGNPVGYVLEIKGGPTIYHTGDTDLYVDMKSIAEFFKVDLMMVCIGGHFTMDPVRAAQAVEWVNPKQVVPMHFGTYGVLKGTPAQFNEALEKRKLGGRMVEMKPGEARMF
ncbi:MAG: metal-dependent hydrolase [Deltaproteobacteria bacterium]|nr:metal-dependent hydrolase [Deltaproteobacteria bacterium]